MQTSPTIEEITYDKDFTADGGWANGIVWLPDGRAIHAGGYWISRGGNTRPYEYSDAGDVDALAVALGLDVDGTMELLREDCPGYVDLAPECVDGGEHDWRAPYGLVGGIVENPGVWGHGGGIVSTEYCFRCGCQMRSDTWAQDPSDGSIYSHPEQVYTSLDEMDAEDAEDVSAWMTA